MSNSSAIFDLNNQTFERYQKNTVALEILICIMMVAILIKEIVQFLSKIYHPLLLQSQPKRYEQNTFNMMEKPPHSSNKTGSQSNRVSKPNEQENQNKGVWYRIGRNIERFTHKLPYIAVVFINIVYLSSYEFITIISYIMVILIFLRSFLHLKFQTAGYILQAITTAFIIAAYITIYITARTVPNPNQQ